MTEEELKKLEECIDEWHRESEEMPNSYTPWGKTQVPALVADVRRLRVALEFYAANDNWQPNYVGLGSMSIVDNDFGKRAREALKGGA